MIQIHTPAQSGPGELGRGVLKTKKMEDGDRGRGGEEAREEAAGIKRDRQQEFLLLLLYCR